MVLRIRPPTASQGSFNPQDIIITTTTATHQQHHQRRQQDRYWQQQLQLHLQHHQQQHLQQQWHITFSTESNNHPTISAIPDNSCRRSTSSTKEEAKIPSASIDEVFFQGSIGSIEGNASNCDRASG